jgi:phage shock protein PspC (stress-responsive transcriptional regulator)
MTENTETMSPPPPGPGPGAPRPLFRSRSDRKVAGVCGGVAEYFGIDPIILRILIAVLTLFGGSGLLIYAAAWLLLPDEGQPMSEIQKLLDRNGQARASSIVLATLVVIGLIVALGSIVGRDWWLGSGPDVWPLLIVGGIGFAIWYSRRTPQPPGSTPPAPPVPQTPPAPYAATYPPPAAAPPAASYAVPDPDPYLPPVPVATVATLTAPKPRRRRSVLGPLTLSVATIAAGVMLPFVVSGRWHLHAVAFFAVLLLVVGLGLVVGSFYGRSRGLIVWGVLLTLITAVAGAVPAIDSKSTGDVTWKPTSASSVPADGYRWAAGNATLDLTALPPASTQSTAVEAQLGAGTLVVIVPPGARVILDAHVGLGSIHLPNGSRRDGFGARYVGGFDPLPGAANAGTLRLHLEIGAGTLEVRHAQA